ncbi:MAG: hypothetical protein PHI97_12755 [Desulfobulbus sp.]|nr:hypothetical protein [Desulfobulbus sp.]
MQMKKIREIAEKMSVVHDSMKKDELIRIIQKKEGNIPCFCTGLPSCQQYDCWWRSDCKPGEMKVLSHHSDS